MNIKEEFWDKYKNVVVDFKENIPIYKELGFYDLDEYREDCYKKAKVLQQRAKSKRWISYDLLQARCETLEDPIRKIKLLGIMECFNEHDAYLAEENVLYEDCEYFLSIGKDGGKCPFQCEICKSNAIEANKQQMIEESNEIWCNIEICTQAFSDIRSKVDRQLKLISDSVLDQAELKTYKIERKQNGKHVFAIYRYKDKLREELCYRAEVPCAVMAKQILAIDSFREQLSTEELEECVSYSKVPTCYILENYRL